MADDWREPFNDYPGFLLAMRQRAQERRIAIGSEATNEYAGLCANYLAKILGPAQIRRVGMTSLHPILVTLGCRLQLIEDPEAMAQFDKRVPIRKDAATMRSGSVHFLISRRAFRKIQRKGGKNSRSYMTKKAASALGRKAALARWNGVRKGLARI